MKDSYEFPPLNLLEKRPIRRLYSDSVINVLVRVITTVLNDKGIKIEKMYPVVIGPSVYYFELVLNEVADIDIIRDYLSGLNIYGPMRIVSLVYGNQLIAIEIPRHDRQTQCLREIFETKSFQNFKGRLPIALGIRTKDNKLFGLSLICMKHLLISGGAGTGKSMLLHCIILSLLYSQTPKELKLVLIDTKNEEFGVYDKIKDRYLFHHDRSEQGVITSDAQAVSTLYSLCEEMDRRLDILSDQGIEEYNEKLKKWDSGNMETKSYLPYIVVVIDEFSELIKIFGKLFEIPLYHLAQMGHKVGIHVVVSTQDTTEIVVTGLLKSVFSARISCKVESVEESRKILNMSGAEHLLGKGDMLYSSDGYITRVQGCFVASGDIESVCNWIAFLDDEEEYQCHNQESKIEEKVSEEPNTRNYPNEIMENVKKSMALIKTLKKVCFCMIESSSESIDMQKSLMSKRNLLLERTNSDKPENREIKEKDMSRGRIDKIEPYINERYLDEEVEESGQFGNVEEKEKIFFFKKIPRMISQKRTVMNKIMFLGIGRGGCKIIDRMRHVTNYSNIRNSRYVFVDCDSHDLHKYEGFRKILMNRSSSEFPTDIFEDVEQLVIVAGMSGFAGSEFSVPALTAARCAGIKSVSMVGILGFMCEGHSRIIRSLSCLDKIKKMSGISLDIYNMGRIADKYGNMDVLSAHEKADEEIISMIEGHIQIKEEGYDWKGYSIIGDKLELDNLINEMDKKRIDEYDVLNTLSLTGKNCVATGEGCDFGMALEQAVDNLLLIKMEKLLLLFCCGWRFPSLSEIASISTVLSKAGVSDKAQVKFDVVKNNKLGDSFKVLIVASRENTDQISSVSVSSKANDGGRKNNILNQIFRLRRKQYE